MRSLRQNYLIYLAALLTLAEIVSAEVVNGRYFSFTRYLAPILGVFSLSLIFAPIFTLQRQGTVQPGGNYMQATVVVDSGLFAIVRHPQYLGYMCLNVTFMLISQHWLVLLLGSLAIIFYYLYALQEEKPLLEKFGSPYREYMRRVPRLNVVSGITRLIRRREQGNRTAQ
jgi:protein-S-isoprenylcysteine O-methyltransferase Ste14